MGILYDAVKDNNLIKQELKKYKIPKSELIRVRYIQNGEIKYLITQDKIREKYILYEVLDSEGNVKKIKTNKEPYFDEYIENSKKENNNTNRNIVSDIIMHEIEEIEEIE